MFLPLSLGAGVKSGAEKKGPQSPDKKQIQKTLDKDDNTCRFCGFSSSKFQRVISYNDDKDKSVLVTSCIFCEQVANLDRGAVTGAGILIWLPEIPQTNLNHIVRAIYMTREAGGAMAELANRAMDALMARRAEAKKRLGSDDPLLLATVLCESLSPAENRKSAAKLNGLRLLPADKYLIRTGQGADNLLPDMLKFWASDSGPFSRMPSDTWEKMFREVESATRKGV